MKIGVSAFLTEHSGEPGAIAQTAEKLGFESFWVAEHLVIPVDYTTYYPRSPDGKVPEFYAHLADPFIALAAAAQATTTIKLGTGICLLPERDTITTRHVLQRPNDYWCWSRLVSRRSRNYGSQLQETLETLP